MSYYRQRTEVNCLFRCTILLASLCLLSGLLSACHAGSVAPPDSVTTSVVGADQLPGNRAAPNYQRAMLDPGTAAVAGAAPRAIGYAVLYYIPNRILDLIDIFRFDLGIGVSYGAVGRITRYGQFGYRGFAPRSFRIGLRGRRSPIFLERHPEYGIGPNFVNTGARIPTAYEVGAGVDVVLVGAYFGVSFDELLDFLGGLVFLDPKRDDLQFK